MLNPQHIANAQAPLDQSTLFVRLPPLLPPTSHVFEDTWLTSCCCLVDNLQPTLMTPWTIAGQAPLSMGFSRQEYWGGLPFPSPGDLPDPGIEPMCPALAGRLFTSEPPGKPGLTSYSFPMSSERSSNFTDSSATI